MPRLGQFRLFGAYPLPIAVVSPLRTSYANHNQDHMPLSVFSVARVVFGPLSARSHVHSQCQPESS
jgi:hypothetical protein